ncbi:ABC transporter permease [Euzebya tangerina]|uniref:ABC transporter permease n=1 Tax=Euzebya tangerina TaxID=591198 RepID=UPI00196B4C81|nr:ABC transporter permease [Euzebya tangerina]
MATTKPGGSGLGKYVLVRLALAPVFLLLLLTLLFVLLRILPGDIVTASLAGRASEERIEAAREAAGIDRPIGVQYVEYLSNIVTGDFGEPLTDPRPVGELVADLLPATIELTVFAMLIAIPLGILLGAVSARFRDTPLDGAARLFGIVSFSIPVFWLGIQAQLVFSVWNDWLPTGNRISARIAPVDGPTGFYLIDGVLASNGEFTLTALEHLILPGATLGLVISGVFVRLVRVNMLQTLRADYVESAHARGVGERPVLFRHAFKNALVPVITIMGLQFALLLGGAILTETTFSWPGIGLKLVDFINARDYVGVQSLVTVIAILIVSVSVVIDIINGLIDPRVRY